MVTVMCAGTFDIIHKGHLFYLNEAKKLGDKLVVVVGRDSTVSKIKNEEPVNDENERLEAVKGLEVVDLAVLGKKSNLFDILEEVKPDVICLGYDQRVEEEDLEKELKKRKIKSKIVRIKGYKVDKYKTSKIKDKIKN
tara:strand:- start:1770 stop:2183 length:414 start_codon:yes stop_codon:yes gene_type:complete